MNIDISNAHCGPRIQFPDPTRPPHVGVLLENTPFF